MSMFFSFASAIWIRLFHWAATAEALVLGPTAGTFGARLCQQLTAARQQSSVAK